MESENPVLELAKEMGYNPDFEGEGKKTPEEFIKHSSTIVKNQSSKIKDLMGTVEGMSSEFANMQKTFLATTEANEKKHKADLERQKAKLEADLDIAIDEADKDQVHTIRKELSNIEKQKIQPKEEINGDQVYFDNWSKDKKWIESDKKAIAAFKIAQIKVMAEHGEGRGAEFELKEIDKLLKEEFPEKYGLKKKELPPAGGVAEGKSADENSKDVKLSTLNATEKGLYNSMKKAAGKKFNEESTLKAIGAMRAAKEKK